MIFPEATEVRAFALFQLWRTCGDPETKDGHFKDLADLLQPAMQGAAHRLLQASDVAMRVRGQHGTMDVVQGLWIKILTKVQGLEIESAKDFAGYLASVILNDIRTRIRKVRARPEAHFESVFDVQNPLSAWSGAAADSNERPDVLAELGAEADTLWIAINLLDEEDHQLAVARWIEELEYAEAALVIPGLTPDAARMRLHKIKARLAMLTPRINRGRLPGGVFDEPAEERD